MAATAERTADAQKMGLIPAGAPLDLAYPRYKEWFQNRCLQLMREDGVNAFKWDKAGDGVSPHFMALLDIARTSAPAESEGVHQRHRRHLAFAVLAEPCGLHLAQRQRRRRLGRQGRIRITSDANDG